jgi:hypothetical protein
MDKEDYDTAISIFNSLGNYSDSAAKLNECKDLKIEKKYQDAITARNTGKLYTAYQAFLGLADYKDSSDIAAELADANPLFTVTVGDTVHMGDIGNASFDLDDSGPILWRVLKVDASRVLLISEYILAFANYDDTMSTINEWATCFSEEEQSMISGQMFLLSNEEVKLYFDTNKDCKTRPRAGGTCQFWWTSTSSNDGVGYVTAQGFTGDDAVKNQSGGIRPAVWFNLE